MEERLIFFETAKLAMEKGFNEPTRGFIEPKYHDTLEFIDDIVLYVYKGYMPLKEHHQVLDDGWYLAPTQSLLQKWLRETHNILLYVEHSFGIWRWVIETPAGYLEEDDSAVAEDEFPSYEDTLERGLLRALKLLT